MAWNESDDHQSTRFFTKPNNTHIQTEKAKLSREKTKTRGLKASTRKLHRKIEKKQLKRDPRRIALGRKAVEGRKKRTKVMPEVVASAIVNPCGTKKREGKENERERDKKTREGHRKRDDCIPAYGKHFSRARTSRKFMNLTLPKYTSFSDILHPKYIRD